MDESSAGAPKTVVIIDDHDIVRYGMQMLIQDSTGLQVVGAASSLREGLELIGHHSPDLVVTDMGTGDSQGLETVRRVIAAQSPRPTNVV